MTLNTTPIVGEILFKVSDLRAKPKGAYNIRVNGQCLGRASTEAVQITPLKDGHGIEVRVKAGTKGEKIHIPVAISATGFNDPVTNNFYIGKNCEDIEIVAGCGIHNTGCNEARHEGTHQFYIGKNAKVTYKEKHYAEGEQTGENIINPITVVHLEEGSTFDMESIQIGGVHSTHRVTQGILADDSFLTVTEKLMTHDGQIAKTEFILELNGSSSRAKVASRSVAKDQSHQEFISHITGNNACMGHSECDAIIMDQATVRATPEIVANHVDAELVHEATIGKIAGEQLTKLMTLGLTQEEAETHIIDGFLR